MSKPKLKEKAIKLRKKGFSYSEILKEVLVAKSTLSLWLRSVGLAKRQKQRLTEKRLKAILKGARKKRNYRVLVTKQIKREAKKEIGRLSKRELWLMGIALYWAEGAKQRPNDTSAGVFLGNSDPEIIKIFLKWLCEIVKIDPGDIEIRLHIHETGDELKAKRYWSKITGIPVSKFAKTIFKKHNIKTNRKFDNSKYYGLLRVVVKKSTNFNRKISGWIEGICENI